MKDLLLSVVIAFVLFGVYLYATDDPSTAHFFELPGTDIRWQLDRRYLWPPPGPVIDANEFDRMVSISEPNSLIIINADGSLTYYPSGGRNEP